MEFFLPSLIVFIIAIAIVFVVLPRLAAPVLVGISLLILGFALYQHVTLFSTEYTLSTWQEQLKFYAPWVLIAGLLVSILIYFATIALTGSPMPVASLPITPALPPAATATNSFTAALNNGIRSVQNVAAPIMGQNNTGGIIRNNRNQGYNQNRSFFSPI